MGTRTKRWGISLVSCGGDFRVVDGGLCGGGREEHFSGIALQPAAAAIHVLEQSVHAADVELSTREQCLICASAVFFLGGRWREQVTLNG